MMATLIGMLLMTQVASSWLVIWKQPSPSTAHTVRSRLADLGAHGGGHGIPHRPEPTGVEPGVGALVLDELRGPHLVLADAGDVDRLRAGDGAEPLEDVLRGERATLRLGVAQRERLLPAGDPLAPLGVVAAPARVVVGVDGLDEVGEDRLAVTDDRDVGPAVLGDLRRVDVGVDDPRLGRERRQLTGDPVVEAGPEGDDEVGLLEPGHRRDGAVHARHPEVEGVAVGQRAARHEGRDDGDPAQLDEAAQLLAGPRADDAAADVEDRALGLAR